MVAAELETEIAAPALRGLITGTLGEMLPMLVALPELQPDRRTWRLVFRDGLAAYVAGLLVRERVQADAYMDYAVREEVCSGGCAD